MDNAGWIESILGWIHKQRFQKSVSLSEIGVVTIN